MRYFAIVKTNYVGVEDEIELEATTLEKAEAEVAIFENDLIEGTVSHWFDEERFQCTEEEFREGCYIEIAYDEEDEADPGEMDGDHASGLASAGFGTDEDYGGYEDYSFFTEGD